MTDKDFLDLGFVKVVDSDNGEPYYYYVYEPDYGSNSVPTLISNDNLSAEKGGWSVNIFDYETPTYTTKEQLDKLIKSLYI